MIYRYKRIRNKGNLIPDFSVSNSLMSVYHGDNYVNDFIISLYNTYFKT